MREVPEALDVDGLNEMIDRMRAGWTPTDQQRPLPNQRVDWIAPSGELVSGGTYAGGLVWFLPGANPMYVYYEPTYWRPANTED